MDLTAIYREEDLFPKEFTSWIERPYGFLFCNEDNKDSYDSNHAIIFKDRVTDLRQTLEDIVRFYSDKGIRPILYQSIADCSYFEKIQGELAEYGFESWGETQKYMVLSAPNTIQPNTDIFVRKVMRWDDAYSTHIFEAAGEPWEIDVAKKVIANTNTLFFVAIYDGQPVGMTYAHVSDGVCRVDYLLVAKEYRKMGVGRALIYAFVEHCNVHKIENCFLWPDGETAEKIYHEAGFRHVATKLAGRAAYKV